MAMLDPGRGGDHRPRPLAADGPDRVRGPRHTRRIVDRENQRAQLHRIADEVRTGSPAAVAIHGPWGIGKSALLAWWEAELRQTGWTVLRAAGCRGPLEPAEPPHQGRRALRHLRPVPTGLPSGQYPPGALLELAADAARDTPVLLAVDDLGPDDTDWLAQLVRRLGAASGRPVLLAALLEAGASSPASRLDDVLEELLDGDAHSVPVTPLSLRGTSELLAAGAVPLDGLAAAVHSATGGNPLLIRRLVRRLAPADSRQQPDRIPALAEAERRRAVATRLERRGGAELDIARAAALLGPGASPEQVAALVGAAPGTTREQLAGLVGSGVLEPDGTCREETRDALLRALPAEIRNGLHTRAAEVLFEAGAGAEQIAAQLCAVAPGGPAWALPILREAADRARQRGAATEALTLLRRALGETADPAGRAALQRDLAELETGVAPTSAVRRLREVAELARTDGHTEELLSRALRLSGRWQEAADAARDGLRAADGEQGELADTLERQWSLAALADLRARHGAVELSHSAESQALWSLLTAQPEQAPAAARAPYCPNAWRSDSPGAPGPRRLERAQVHGWAALLADRSDTCCPPGCAVAEPADQAGREHRLFLDGWRAHAALWRGALDEAQSWAERAPARYPDQPPVPPGPSPVAALVTVHLERGETARAERLLAQARRTPHSLDEAVLLELTGRLRLAAGDDCAALETLLHCGDELDRVGVCHPVLVPWRRTAALAWAALGNAEQARELLRADARLAERLGSARALGLNQWAWGTVSAGAERREHLRCAVRRLERSPARLDLARALADLAETEAGLGDQEAAARHAAQARALARVCGSPPLTARAEAVLGAGAAEEPVRSLTKAQQRVAELAAEGLSNRDIAGRLYVTLRTVEIHLTQAYRRLGVSSRGELARALA